MEDAIKRWTGYRYVRKGDGENEEIAQTPNSLWLQAYPRAVAWRGLASQSQPSYRRYADEPFQLRSELAAVPIAV